MRRLMTIIITIATLALLLVATTYAAPTDDLTAPYDIPTEDQLASALRYELVQYAGAYIKAAEKYGINVYFLVAKDALESGWGRYRAAPNNLGGWTADNGGYMTFESVEAYIDHTAHNLRDMYLTPDGIYHTGYTHEDVGVYYNGSAEWVEAVADIWRTIEGRCRDGQTNT